MEHTTKVILLLAAVVIMAGAAVYSVAWNIREVNRRRNPTVRGPLTLAVIAWLLAGVCLCVLLEEIGVARTVARVIAVVALAASLAVGDKINRTKTQEARDEYARMHTGPWS